MAGLPKASAQVPRSRRMPLRPSAAKQEVLPINTITSGFTNATCRVTKGSIIAISAGSGSRFCGGRQGMTLVM